MKLAIMQPYFFPYIGYFQLINAVDKFVFYDDVNFIKNGWINRNRILIQGRPVYFTVQLKEASPFKPINVIEFSDNRHKMLKTIQMNYAKAPYFENVFPIIEKCLKFKTNLISDLAINSVREVTRYFELNTVFEISGTSYPETKHFDKAQRILSICKSNNITTYLNVFAGKEIYTKEEFSEKGVKLFFLKSKEINYKQFQREFVPWLSIIDVIMFNSVENIHRMLDNYELV